MDHYGICWCLPTWGTATVNGPGPWGMHAPSRFPSLHRTPGPLSVPPFHLHLKGGRPRRPSLCSLPYSRNDLIYLFINGNICLWRAIPPLSSPASRDGWGSSKKRDLWSSMWSQTQRTPVTVLDSCDAGDFLSAPRLTALRHRRAAGGWGWHNAKQRRLCSWGIRFPRLMEHDRLAQVKLKGRGNKYEGRRCDRLRRWTFRGSGNKKLFIAPRENIRLCSMTRGGGSLGG